VSLRSLLNTLSGNVIDSIDSAADLDDLRNGLERLGNTRRQLLLSLGLGLIALMWPMVWNKMGVKPPGGGITLYDGSERLESRQGAIQCTQRGRTRRGCLAGSIYAIQAKIEKLETQGDIGSKETMEAIGRLMDYHDRIKAAPTQHWTSSRS
jgi:hypothetical protein